LRQGTYSKIYSSEVDTKYGVRLRELESAPLAWFAPKLSPHSLPILIQREYKSEHSSLMDSVLQVRGGALFIVLQGRYRAWRQLQAGKTVVLSFHAKGEHQRLMKSGPGRPPLCRPACLPYASRPGVATDPAPPSRGRT